LHRSRPIAKVVASACAQFSASGKPLHRRAPQKVKGAGLRSAVDAGSKPGNFLALWQIRVLNRGTTAIQNEMVDKSTSRANDPSAVTALVNQPSTRLTVVGDVNNPGRFLSIQLAIAC
jgi:hypothetical protein